MDILMLLLAMLTTKTFNSEIKTYGVTITCDSNRHKHLYAAHLDNGL